MTERIESLRIHDRSMGLRDCLVKMCSRRVAARKHADEPFDKCTSEYYSCGKKAGVQNRRLACDVLCKTGNIEYPAGVDVVNAHSSTSDSEASESSCSEDDGSKQGARLCGVSWKSAEKSCVDYIKHGKVNGLSIILAENKAPGDDHNMDVEVQKMGAFPPMSTENRDHIHDRSGDCDVGFSSQHGYEEEESSWEYGISALSLSPARGAVRKKFPPPLTMLAMQSYSDKRGRSPEACAAGYCLRSFRQDGRFVLQEVRAPAHKYFRVLREEGRLKLELFNADGNSSQEDDETSASDVCMGVKSPMLGVVTKVLYASNTHAEDTCKGTAHVGVHALCDEMKTVSGGNTGCVRTYELMSTSRAKPLERASDIQWNSEVKAEATDISSDVGPSAKEQMLQGNLISPEAFGAEDMVSPLIESPSSPRCPEMTVVYDGPSTTIKRSWVCPISAF